MKPKIILTLCLLAVVSSGCLSARIKPGRTQAATGDGATASAVQSQDPNAPTTQQIETETTFSRVLPAGSIVVSGSDTNLSRTTLSAPATESATTRKVITTSVGPSQRDTAQDIAAKLASIRWLQWIGILLALFGGASLFYPPLAAVINSPTTSVWCIAVGGAMIFLPLIIVGHEILILGVGIGVILLWFFAHSHGSVTAELNALKNVLNGAQPAPTPTYTPPAAPASTPPTTN
jgi:hypothetical protein